jgi:hypothetical protein
MTAEEILQTSLDREATGNSTVVMIEKSAVLNAMESYASERTKELEKENETLNIGYTHMTSQVDDFFQLVRKLQAENLRLREALENGRHYLMGVSAQDITVDDALESFGFGRNGLDNP